MLGLSVAAGLLITEVISGGAGCPQGTVQVVMSPDATAMTVLYDAFHLNVKDANSVAIMDCEVRVKFEKPAATNFGIESADFRGFVSLEPGLVALQKVHVRSGSTREERLASAEFAEQRWIGPVNEEFILTTHRPSGVEMVGCHPTREKTRVVIRSRIRINSRRSGGSGQLTVDSVDGRVAQKFNLKWQSCPARLINKNR